MGLEGEGMGSYLNFVFQIEDVIGVTNLKIPRHSQLGLQCITGKYTVKEESEASGKIPREILP